MHIYDLRLELLTERDALNNLLTASWFLQSCLNLHRCIWFFSVESFITEFRTSTSTFGLVLVISYVQMSISKTWNPSVLLKQKRIENWSDSQHHGPFKHLSFNYRLGQHSLLTISMELMLDGPQRLNDLPFIDWKCKAKVGSGLNLALFWLQREASLSK